MLNILKKIGVVGLLSLVTLSSNAYGQDCCYDCCDSAPSKFYIGVFGGGGQADSTHVTQKGIAFFPAEVGGPLYVNASGHDHSYSASIVGMNLGYQLKPMNGLLGWCLQPAIELEGYYLKRHGNSKTGDLINVTDRLPEHDFVNTLHMDSGVFLANAVVAFDIPCLTFFKPYVGVGIGATKIWISKAKSEQFSPPEAGVNHFNSRRSDSDWTFAVQTKIGLRFDVTCNWGIFTEYRFLHVNASDYTFGETRYADHAPTTDWNLHKSGVNYNIGVIGITYSL